MSGLIASPTFLHEFMCPGRPWVVTVRVCSTAAVTRWRRTASKVRARQFGASESPHSADLSGGMHSTLETWDAEFYRRRRELTCCCQRRHPAAVTGRAGPIDWKLSCIRLDTIPRDLSVPTARLQLKINKKNVLKESRKEWQNLRNKGTKSSWMQCD